MHGDLSKVDGGASDFSFGQDYLAAAGLATAGFGGDADDIHSSEMPDIHAINAQTAAYHADNAAKHAASTANQAVQLAHWVQHLWTQTSQLEAKVKELEEWKKKTLEDMRKLREEHKQLRKKLGPSVGPTNDDEEKDKPVPTLGATTAMPGIKKAVSMPPGLDTVPEHMVPPGLPPPRPVSQSSSTVGNSTSTEEFSDRPTSTDSQDSGGQNEGVTVSDEFVKEHDIAKKVSWRIGHLSSKLKGVMGRPLVSPPFSVFGMEDLRLMIYPDQKELSTGPRSRKQKEDYNKKVTLGPLDGVVKLKVPNPPAHPLTYHLQVGDDTSGELEQRRSGAITHNFLDCAVSESTPFGIDWLQYLDASDGGLTVAVDILKARQWSNLPMPVRPMSSNIP